MGERRVMIAAPRSGCGKTTVACGLMEALKNRGYKVAAAKCGPDYIDPMFHRKVLGVDSQNVDLFFCSPEVLEGLFKEHISGADVAVIEGVMGYYDGMSLDSEKAGSYEVAKALQTPVLLVVDCKGAALSVLALLKGFLTFRRDHQIAGIILNRVSGAAYPRMKEMVDRGLADMGHPVPVVGYVPEKPVFHIGSRHLGLVTPEEIGGLRETIKEAGEVLAQTLDLERILQIAGTAPPLGLGSEGLGRLEKVQGPSRRERVRLAVARDLAFGFYYKDNLRLLEKMGCELVPFSPLKDHSLPEGIQGLLLGGGYPELYAETLSGNTSLRRQIKEMLRQGLPCHAECGGFLYLHEAVEGEDGKLYEMAGFIEGEAVRKERLVRFGYLQMESVADGGYLPRGETMKGHEFHYWDSSSNGDSCIARKPGREMSWSCVHTENNVFAGFPHVHYYSNPRFAQRFVDRMRTFGPGNQ